jgi:hypothetical protein
MKRRNKNGRFPIGRHAQLSFELLELRTLMNGSPLLDLYISPSVGPMGGPTESQELAWGGYNQTAAALGGGVQKLLSGVPAYIWYRGCGPTSAGMVVGYWDMHGYPNLIAGDSSTQTASVDSAIASTEHYNDYSLPLDDNSTGILADRSTLGGAHANNSIADWMHTSWSSDGMLYGWSDFSRVDDAIDSYCNWKGYPSFTTTNEAWGAFTWNDFKTEIDAGRPMVFLVDSDANGTTDHFVPAIGYDDTLHRYACYNTWDTSVHWYDFSQMASGQQWGIYGATFTTPSNQTPIIGSLSVSPDPVIQGSTLTLTANSVTDSDGTVAKVEFYRDVNGNSSIDVGTDMLLGTDTSSTGGWTWTGSTSGFPLGSNTYMAQAQDDDSAWSNTVTTTGTVNPFKPDLRGDSFPSPGPLVAGQAFNAAFTVENDGNADAGAFRVDFYLSSDSTISASDRLLGSYNVSGLAAHTFSSTLNKSLTLPGANDTFWNGDGTYYCGMIVDAGNAVDESNELNNANRGQGYDWTPVQITGTGNSPDRFEPNDSFAAATDFGTMGSRTENNLSIHAANNDDYYKFFAASTGTLNVDINFTHSQGDLDLYLYNSSQTLLAVSNGLTNNEHISYSVAAGQLYYIRVVGYNGATNPNYNLVIDGPVILTQDRFEPNDSFAAATNFGTLTNRTENNLSIHAAYNDDYYKFIAAGSGILNVDINFTHAHGDLDLFLYNSGQSLIAYSEGTVNNEHVSYSVTAGQSYYIKVIGYNGATNPSYNLIVDGHNLHDNWDGGSLVNNLWTTKENWIGDVAPLPGDNLVFPAGAARIINFNDYTSATIFGSITVSGSGYHFQGNSYQASMVGVQPNTNVEVNAIHSDTLTLGAGSVFTISPIPAGPQAQRTINHVKVITNASLNNIKTAPISLDASSPDPAIPIKPVVIYQPLPAETIDPAPAPAPVVFEQPLPAEAIDLPPAQVTIALNLPLSAKPVEILSARESNSKIRDILFSQPEQELLFPTARTNSLSNDAPGKSPSSESVKQSNASLAFDNVPRQKAFVPRSILSIASARDLALQQALHEDWGADWLWNDDLEKIKKRQKDDFNGTVPLAWALVLNN